MIRVLVCLSSGEGFLPAYKLPTFPCFSYGVRSELALLGLLYKGTNPNHRGFALMTRSPPKDLTS